MAGYGAPLGTTQTGTLDPLRTYELLYFNLQHQIFETLVATDFNTQTIVPVLAESWQQTSDTTIRFHLRHGVRFHNGEPFTAAAVKFSLELMQDPRNNFAGRFLLESIANAVVVDDYTVDIVLRSIDVLIMRKLAAIGFIFPPTYYRRVGDAYFTRYPMGTGPLRFFYNEIGAQGLTAIHLVANEDYWQHEKPAFKELVYSFMPAEQQWVALQRGDIDLVITQHIDREEQLRGKGSLNIFSRTSLRHSACILNIDKQGPLADLRVRRALQHIVDRPGIIQKALHGHGKPLFVSVPEGTMAAVPNRAVYDADPAMARKLLAEAGHADGLTLRVLAADFRPARDVVGVLQEQCRQVGVTLDVDFLTREKIASEIIAPKLKGSAAPSAYDVWVLTGWPDIFGTGTYFYAMCLRSHGMFNFGIHLNQASPIDELYAQAVSSKNREEFQTHLLALDRHVMDQALIIPLYQVDVIYGMRGTIAYDPGLNDLPHRFWQCVIQ
jgi:peptide/nickel transport system substrate-binding protein